MKGITLSPLEARDLLVPRLEEEISGDGGSAALVSRARLRIWKLREGVSGGRIWLRFSPPHPPPPYTAKQRGPTGLLKRKREEGERGIDLLLLWRMRWEEEKRPFRLL